MLTLLTVGTHQPYSAPFEYMERYDTPKQAAVAYLDDALGAFLDNLERQGVLKDTLVVVTSDESHGIDGAPGLVLGFNSPWRRSRRSCHGSSGHLRPYRPGHLAARLLCAAHPHGARRSLAVPRLRQRS